MHGFISDFRMPPFPLSPLPNSTSLADFLLVSILSGFADAMVSGTDEAIMYDSLVACGRVAEFQEVWHASPLLVRGRIGASAMLT